MSDVSARPLVVTRLDGRDVRWEAMTQYGTLPAEGDRTREIIGYAELPPSLTVGVIREPGEFVRRIETYAQYVHWKDRPEIDDDAGVIEA